MICLYGGLRFQSNIVQYLFWLSFARNQDTFNSLFVLWRIPQFEEHQKKYVRGYKA